MLIIAQGSTGMDTALHELRNCVRLPHALGVLRRRPPLHILHVVPEARPHVVRAGPPLPKDAGAPVREAGVVPDQGERGGRERQRVVVAVFAADRGRVIVPAGVPPGRSSRRLSHYRVRRDRGRWVRVFAGAPAQRARFERLRFRPQTRVLVYVRHRVNVRTRRRHCDTASVGVAVVARPPGGVALAAPYPVPRSVPPLRAVEALAVQHPGAGGARLVRRVTEPRARRRRRRRRRRRGRRADGATGVVVVPSDALPPARCRHSGRRILHHR